MELVLASGLEVLSFHNISKWEVQLGKKKTHTTEKTICLKYMVKKIQPSKKA